MLAYLFKTFPIASLSHLLFSMREKTGPLVPEFSVHLFQSGTKLFCVFLFLYLLLVFSLSLPYSNLYSSILAKFLWSRIFHVSNSPSSSIQQDILQIREHRDGAAERIGYGLAVGRAGEGRAALLQEP